MQDIEGVGFKTADKIAMKMGVAFDSDIRIRAGIIFALTEIAEKQGSTVAYTDELKRVALEILELNENYLENVEDGLVFSRDGDRIWKCRNCGHIVIGKQAPEVCPVCTHPKAYFEIKAENY